MTQMYISIDEQLMEEIAKIKSAYHATSRTDSHYVSLFYRHAYTYIYIYIICVCASIRFVSLGFSHIYIYIYIRHRASGARASWNVMECTAACRSSFWSLMWVYFVAFFRLYILDHLFDRILDRFLMDFWINMSPQTHKNQVKQLVCLP